MASAEPHPGLERLAEHAEGLLSGDDAARVDAHLAGCSDCRAQVAAVAGVRAALAAAPPEAMPADVASRLDAALAAAEPAAPARRRWFSDPRVLGAAAGVVLLAVGVAVGVGLSTGGGGRAGSSAGTNAAAGGSAGFTQTASGRDYDATSLAAALPQLLGTGGRAFSTDQSTAPVPSPAPTGHGQGGAASAVRAAEPSLDRLSRPANLLACVSGIAGNAVPLAVDLAKFAGRPAAVVVLPSPGHAGQLDVWVVGPGCTRADPDLIYFARLPRPGG